MNLKNDPEKNIELRERYGAIKSGYHMNKKHWNTVEIDGSIADKIIRNLIDESYNLIVLNLPQKKRRELKGN